ncbi:MAG TPA: hypothetical protein VM865_03980 [Acidobacteriaceae bacterium]|nr:hypothetical protein [Acidobacteriaceae bacterium]
MTAEQAMEQGQAERSTGGKPLRPGQCERYLRETLAAEFRAIVGGFVTEARNGGCAHMKLAAELLESKKPVARRKKGTARRLLEQIAE